MAELLGMDDLGDLLSSFPSEPAAGAQGIADEDDLMGMRGRAAARGGALGANSSGAGPGWRGGGLRAEEMLFWSSDDDSDDDSDGDDGGAGDNDWFREARRYYGEVG